jgi:hypothetical protein
MADSQQAGGTPPDEHVSHTPETSSSTSRSPSRRIIAMRAKMQVPWALIFLVLLLLAGGVCVWWKVGRSAEWERSEPGRHYNRTNLYSIKYPEGWGLRWESDGKVEVAVQLANNELTGESIRVTLVKDDSERRTPDLDAVADALVFKIVKPWNKAREEIRGSGTVDGVRVKWMLYGGEDEGEPVKLLHYCLIKSDRVFSIACRAPEGTFERWRADFEAAVKSFKTK